MCILSGTAKQVGKTKGRGYKVLFKEDDGTLHTGICGVGRVKLNTGQWTHDPRLDQRGERGFNICTRKDEATKMLEEVRRYYKVNYSYTYESHQFGLFQVQYTGAFLSGLANWSRTLHPKCVLASDILVGKEVKP